MFMCHCHQLFIHLLFPQHLQVTDKRTCWHGNAGGGLNADPKNVVSKTKQNGYQEANPHVDNRSFN